MAGGPRSPKRVRIVGPGRAGNSFGRALQGVGWELCTTLGRGDDPTAAARDVDLVVIATPDRDVAEVATAIEPCTDALVIHLAGALGLDVLSSHPRRGALHPLVSMPDAKTGARRLRAGAWFALAAGDPDDQAQLEELVAALGGRTVVVADADRIAYHAAAVVASNHLTALMGQVEHIAASTGVSLEAFVALATQTLDGIAEHGPATALTGPVARGDWSTVAAHLRSLDEIDRPGYAAMAELASRLVPDSDPPAWLERAARGDEVPIPDDAASATEDVDE